QGSHVLGLGLTGNDLYVGGFFDRGGGNPANNIARWDTLNSWSALSCAANNGTDGIVVAIAISGSNVYVGGIFDHAGVNPAHNIARWDDSASTWSALISGGNNGTNGPVLAIAGGDSYGYEGGDFTTAGGCNPCNHRARRN